MVHSAINTFQFWVRASFGTYPVHTCDTYITHQPSSAGRVITRPHNGRSLVVQIRYVAPPDGLRPRSCRAVVNPAEAVVQWSFNARRPPKRARHSVSFMSHPESQATRGVTAGAGGGTSNKARDSMDRATRGVARSAGEGWGRGGGGTRLSPPWAAGGLALYAMSVEVGVYVDHAALGRAVVDWRGATCARPPRAAAARRGRVTSTSEDVTKRSFLRAEERSEKSYGTPW